MKEMRQAPEIGYIYYLKDFTAPKVYNGEFYECLLTTQKIEPSAEIVEDTGIHLDEWNREIYLVERFDYL